MKHRVFLFFVLFPSFLFAQEAGETGAGDQAAPGMETPFQGQAADSGGSAGYAGIAAADDQTVFYIKNIDFDITGRTRPFALLRNGELEKGQEIRGKANFERYLRIKAENLQNQRVLDSAEITYALETPGADGRVPVNLLVKTVDTRNFVILPEPRFSSNDGLDIELKARDYNFLGTMAPLRFDLGYILESEDLWNWGDGSFSFVIDSDTPFTLFGRAWNFNFDHDFKYTLGEPLYYRNITGISLEVPWKRTTFTFGFEESFIFNEKNDTVYQEKFGKYENFYMSSEAYASWKIPLGLEIGEFGELAYTPKLSGKINYKAGGMDEIRKGPSAAFSQSLGFRRVNWQGNFRNGLEAAIANSNGFNFYRQDWTVDYELLGMGYKRLTNFFGVSSRLQFKQYFFTNNFLGGYYPAYAEIGDRLRGIKDDSVIAQNTDFMLSWNIDFPIRALHFVPSEWFHTRRLQYLNFDLHLSPFLDMALLKGGKEVTWKNGAMTSSKRSYFVPEDMLFAAGAEIIVFPLTWRSFYLRASIGYDLNRVARTGDMSKWDEITIAVGHYY